MKKLIFGMLCILGSAWGPELCVVIDPNGKEIFSTDQPTTYSDLYTNVRAVLLVEEDSRMPFELKFFVNNEELNEGNAAQLLSADGTVEISCTKIYNKIALSLSRNNPEIIVHFQIRLKNKELRDSIEQLLQGVQDCLSIAPKLGRMLGNVTSIRLTNGDDQLTLKGDHRYSRCSPWAALSRIDRSISVFNLPLSQITREHVLGRGRYQYSPTNYYWTIE
jgi:hypothetical protein